MTVDRCSAEAAGPPAPPDDGYKWIALTNTTAGVLLATIDGSILIIAMPDIFRGIAGPISGRLSDRFGSRPFATGGMLGAAVGFVLLELLPVNFSYPAFAGILLLNGLLLGASALVHLPAAKAAVLTGRSFLPGLLTGPFRAGLHIAFAFSIACCLIAAWASWSRGAKFAAVEPDLMPAAEEVT